MQTGRKLNICVFLWIFVTSLSKAESVSQPPNIILIYADDLGWNDVSFHGSPEIPTPNIDSLALNGVVLHNYYAEYMCTPSRSALLTGKYPIRLGLQHFVLKVAEESGLPLNETVLPQHLKRLGYSTHLIGKWHLGFSKKDYLPTHRGFDSFFGYLNGKISYYDYTDSGITGLLDRPIFVGVSLYNNTTPITNFRGQYATNVFTEKAKDIISNHDKSKPLFLYFAHLAAHQGNKDRPLEAPPEIISKFKYIKSIDRRIYAAMVSALDDSVGSVIESLHDNDMLDNSIIVFASDNGGEFNTKGPQFSSNHPLRGVKRTCWEGGIRVPAVLWSPLLRLTRPRIATHLMHVSDWLPTLYRAAGGDPNDLGDIDGFDMWSTIKDGATCPRRWLLNCLDNVWDMRALRMGRAKMLKLAEEGDSDEWYGRSGFEDINGTQSVADWVFRNGSPVQNILNATGHWIVQDPNELYSNVRVRCHPPRARAAKCVRKPCLFFVDEDPCEHNDVADGYPEIVHEMSNFLSLLEDQAVPSQFKSSDPRGDPLCHNFTYVPWLEPEHLTSCDFTD